MTKLDELYTEAEQSDILIVNTKLSSVGSMSVCDNGDCIVAVDESQSTVGADILVRTAHELGHCQTHSFYTTGNHFQVRSKMEYKADKWAIQRLIPFDQLNELVLSGVTEPWDLAEHFGVTEDYLRRAVEIYTAMGKIAG